MITYSHGNEPVLRRSLEFTQYLAVRYTERLTLAWAVASVGSRGDSYDGDDPVRAA
jgi:putative transposase